MSMTQGEIDKLCPLLPQFKFYLNFRGYYNLDDPDRQAKISYTIGSLCVIEMLWIIKIQFEAVNKLKRLKAFRDSISDTEWKKLYMRTPKWMVHMCQFAMCTQFGNLGIFATYFFFGDRYSKYFIINTVDEENGCYYDSNAPDYLRRCFECT